MHASIMHKTTPKSGRRAGNGRNETKSGARKHHFLFAMIGAASLLSPHIGTSAPQEMRSAPAVQRPYRPDNSNPAVASTSLLNTRARSQSRMLPSLPEALLTELKRQDVAEAAHRLRIGFGRSFEQPVVVSPATTSAGEWTALPNGWKAWSLEVTSAGALGMRLHLQSVALPRGARLLAYDPAKPDSKASVITAETLRAEKEVWTESVFAERVVLECQVPPGMDPGRVTFTVAELSHFYRSLQPTLRALDGPDVSCIPEVACYSDWLITAAGVARIVFISGGDVFLCTGCLLNDSQPLTFVDYFLTAHHCITGPAVASTAEFFWFDQTAACTNSAESPDFAHTSGGADFLAGSAVSDFAFLRLRQTSPSNVTYLGWTSEPPAANETLATIEHPGDSTKKIAFGHQAGLDRDFLQVLWDIGVTEEGASGSPLLNANHQVIGQLYGGFSSCNNPSGVDSFGRFDVTFKVIRQWLDTAAFAINKGVYFGLFADTKGVAHESSGFFTVTLNAKGAYTGSLQLAGRRYSLSGQMDSSTARASKTVLRPGASSLSVEFGLDSAPESQRVTGTISDGQWVAQLMAGRAVFNARTNPAPYAGSYTLVFPGTNGVDSAPAGNGFGTVRVDTGGRVKLVGSLADGTPVSQSIPVARDGQWPFYASLYGGKGSTLGWLNLTNRATDDLNGTVSWIKEPQPQTKRFANGFTNGLIPAIGSAYAPTIPVINLPTGAAVFTGGDLPPFTNIVSLSSNNKLLNQSPNSLTLNVVLPTGAFNGSVTAPGATRKTPFKGVFLRKANAGYGYFLGTDQSGSVVIAP